MMRRHGAFTLLELLMVIAIVAVLAGLLSGAINHTKAKAHQISCLNNLRQLQVGWFLYADDNDEELALNRSVPGPVNERIFGRRNSTNSWVVGNPKEDITTANIQKGSIFPYTRSADLYRCPSDRSTVLLKPSMRRNRTYSMSAYLNGDLIGIDPLVKGRLSDLAQFPPDKIFVFIEEHEASAWSGSFSVMPRQRFALSSGSWLSTPADLHNQGCNLSFADGHIEYWRWYSPKKGNLLNKSVIQPQEVRDLRRLQEAVPKN